MRDRIAKPSPLIRDPSPGLGLPASVSRTPSWHRRAQSTTQPTRYEAPGIVAQTEAPSRQEHKRSFSMPMRGSTLDESGTNSSEDDGSPTTAGPTQRSDPTISFKSQLPPLELLDPIDVSKKEPIRPISEGGGGWWDVVSAVDNDSSAPYSPAPWHDNPRATARKRTSSSAGPPGLTLPPGAEAAQLPDHKSTYVDISRTAADPPTPPRTIRFSPRPIEQAVLSPSRKGSPGTRSPGRTSNDPSSNVSSTVNLDEETAPRISPPPLSTNLPRPMLFSAHSSDGPPFSVIPPTPITQPVAGSQVPPPTRSKLGGFGRSMSFAMNRSKKEDKENEREKLMSGKKASTSPGKWNRDMVADIMGPPAERK